MTTYRKLNETNSLILTYAEPGPEVTETKFKDWYDNEHIPARSSVPGVLSAYRYKAVDSQSPSWLALYDIASPAVAHSPEYRAPTPNASLREKQIIADVVHIDHRVYEHVLSMIHPKTKTTQLPGRYLFAVHMRVTLAGEEDFNRWYNEEHMVLLSKIPGWLCGRRYKLLESVSRGIKVEPREDEKPYADYLAIHELEQTGFMGLPEFNHAIQTPWRERVMRTILSSELRLFERYHGQPRF